MGDREIHRNDKGYYVGTWDGQEIRYPSVTTALNVLTDFSMVAPDVLERAGKFGTAVHTLIEYYETNRLDRETIDPILETILGAWERCKSSHKIIVHKAEVKIVSTKYKFAGQLDIIGSVRGVNSIVEIKSRPYNPITDKLQTIGYFQAYNESYPEDRVFKRYFCGFDLEGGYNFHEVKKLPGEPDHLSIFLSALAIFKWEGVCR